MEFLFFEDFRGFGDGIFDKPMGILGVGWLFWSKVLKFSLITGLTQKYRVQNHYGASSDASHISPMTNSPPNT